MKFTKTEINLCRQIAEKHRKDIKYGDWYWSTSHNKPLVAIASGFKANNQKFPRVFKIWTIEDCLEFLREKGGAFLSVTKEQSVALHWDKYGRGKTPLEALLKAVLAVVEKTK